MRGVDLRLDRLARHFGLDAFDLDLLLICLAVEVDLRYERLHACPHDDVTRRRPSVELALRGLAPSDRDALAAWRHLGAAWRPPQRLETGSSPRTARARLRSDMPRRRQRTGRHWRLGGLAAQTFMT